MDRKLLLKALGISYERVAKRAGVTRQAVYSSPLRTGNTTIVAQELIDEARLNPVKMAEADRLRKTLNEFLGYQSYKVEGAK